MDESPIDSRQGADGLILAGSAAYMLGIGMQRFAYTPLIPVLIAYQWLTPSQAAYVGATNLFGYLFGAFVAPFLAAPRRAPLLLRAAMSAICFSFLACAFPLSFPWYLFWRFASGVSGGALTVIAAPLVLHRVPPARRGFASGVLFLGVGIGIVFAGTIEPQLLEEGLATTWIYLGIASAMLIMATWTQWPRPPQYPETLVASEWALPPRPERWALRGLYLEYGCVAAALVPHTLFLVDYVVRGLGRGPGEGTIVWLTFGASAVAGPVITGSLSDWIAARRLLLGSLLVLTATIGLPDLVIDSKVSLLLSATVVGCFATGIVPVILARVREILRHAPYEQRAWSYCTMAFGLGQALGAYGFSYIYSRSNGGYATLFALGAVLPLIGIALGIFVNLTAERPPARANP